MATLTETFIRNRERIQPTDTNNYGTAHGGNVVKWMDEVGAMAAMRHAGETCVTGHIGDLDFERPVPGGDICLIEGYVYAVGRTSLRVRLQAYGEEPRTGERERTVDARFLFVAVDEDGRPTPVPDLRVETDRDERLRDEALAAEGGE
jgi:acyl-CoA hydrolase